MPRKAAGLRAWLQSLGRRAAIMNAGGAVMDRLRGRDLTSVIRSHAHGGRLRGFSHIFNLISTGQQKICDGRIMQYIA
jgi:hypothetical protein